MGFKDKLVETNTAHPLLKAKAFYLFYESAIRTLPQYLGLYYKHTLLLSPHQVAMLLSVRPFLLLFGSPFLGFVADKTNRFRHILIISLFAFLLTYITVPLIEPAEGFNCKEHVEGNSSRNFSTLKKHIIWNHEIATYNSKVDAKNHTYKGKLMEDLYYTWPFDMFQYESTDDITRKVFITLLIITIIGEFIASPSETFIDVYTLQALDKSTDRKKFGWQIMPGLVGWFAISLGFSILTNIKLTLRDDFCHVGHIINYSPYLYVLYALLFACILIAFLLNFRKNPPRENDSGYSCNFWKAIPVLAETPAYTAYTIAVIFCGFGCGVKRLFVYHYITELGGPNQLLIVILIIHFVSSFIGLAISPVLLDKFGSCYIMAAGLLSIGFSFVVYSVIINPWIIILVEPLQGLCDHLSWVAIVTYAGAPPHIGAALQGTVHGFHRGLGIAFGYYVVSFLILKFGYVNLFLSLGLIFFVVFGLFVFVVVMYPKESIAEAYSSRYSLLAQTDEDEENVDEETEMRNPSGYEEEVLDKSFLSGGK